MEAKEFIQTTIDNLNIEMQEILKQNNYLDAIFYFDIEADLLYDEFKYLPGDKQLKFLQGLAKLLPFSQKLYAKFIEHAEQKEELAGWIINSNEKYLDTLYEIFGGGDFEESYEQIEDRIMTLNDTLGKLEAGYLQNKITRKKLEESLGSLQSQNNNVLNEITELEKSLEQVKNQYNQNKSHKKQLKDDIDKLQTKFSNMEKDVKTFQAQKKSLQNELNKLTDLQKKNDIELNKIKDETQKVLSQNEIYKKEQERLEKFKKELQVTEKATKLLTDKLNNYFGTKKADMEKELNDIKAALKKLSENFEKPQEEKIIEDVSKGTK